MPQQYQTMQVVVPAGVRPGGAFNAQTPHGLVSVTVPPGMPVQANGQIVMTIQVPVKQQVVQQVVQQPQMVVQHPQVAVQQQMVVQQHMMPVPQVQQVAQVQYPQQTQYPQQGMPAQQVQLQQVQLQQMQLQQAQQVQPMTPAPQPQVMQQQQSATPPAERSAMTPNSGAPAKKGKSGEVVYSVNLAASGDDVCGPACCDRTASPVGQLERSKKMPVELASNTSMSASAWDLILEKLVAHQGQIACYPVPGCQPWCALSCGCCCACAVCLICAHSNRDSWEARIAEEMNDMLKKFGLCVRFEKAGVLNHSHARFRWL